MIFWFSKYSRKPLTNEDFLWCADCGTIVLMADALEHAQIEARKKSEEATDKAWEINRKIFD